ncbi:hypothetical protein SAMN06297164_2528 [Nitrosomonas ureae]|uniref:Uncharacterized protein n=1 Tax=Nitrosomonas ureae TaxID=44577 RepID=A0A286ACC1_9PROT|nr:hypothetical protein SAMN06297164_2528 [Nitrosomonas ureae]
MENSKQCSQCKEIKPHSSFSLNSLKHGELNSYCKLCYETRDQLCAQCNETKQFSELFNYKYLGSVICKNCYEELLIKKKKKSI